jgi:competence protein ComEC
MNNPPSFSVSKDNLILMKIRTGYFAYLAIASCLGIAVSRSGTHWGPLSLLIVFFLWIYLQDKKPLRLLLLTLLFSAGFYGYMNMIESQNVSVHTGSETRISGTITTSIHIDGNKASFEMKSNKKESMVVEYYLQEQQELTLLESLEIGELCNWRGFPLA